jgi:hypothetical protein
MAEFAIVRQDGEVDKVSGLSVQDVANQYGWPGNGEIVPWDAANHASNIRHSFASPAEQHEALDDKPEAAAAAKTPDAPVVNAATPFSPNSSALDAARAAARAKAGA